jgi:hypothetical protein
MRREPSGIGADLSDIMAILRILAIVNIRAAAGRWAGRHVRLGVSAYNQGSGMKTLRLTEAGRLG